MGELFIVERARKARKTRVVSRKRKPVDENEYLELIRIIREDCGDMSHQEVMEQMRERYSIDRLAASQVGKLFWSVADFALVIFLSTLFVLSISYVTVSIFSKGATSYTASSESPVP